MISEQQINDKVRELFDNIEFTREPEGLYDPLRYMISIGGKRIRPKLCMTAYSLFSDTLCPEIEQPAAALEVFHTFTLIHDDIMDRSPLRRGQETVWKKWKEDTAILSGDVMLIDSYSRITATHLKAHGEILSLFTKTAAQVCEGQQYDMDFESESEVSMDQYEKMIGLKTAVLLACSAKIGALVGGATPAQADALYSYGYELGMAFQVADDYLDAFGDEKVFGKPIGGDIIQQKKSWLTVCAMKDAAARGELEAAMALPSGTPEQKAAKIKSVKDIYVRLGVDASAKKEIGRFTDNALKAVEGIGLGAVKLETLKRFAYKLVGREN
ncbi:MAG: polyprenyl synthetase family protein [Bacteroidales bacterium]|nr:polyprenyl synthetase family protein [Bacteroidales bacterium]